MAVKVSNAQIEKQFDNNTQQGFSTGTNSAFDLSISISKGAATQIPQIKNDITRINKSMFNGDGLYDDGGFESKNYTLGTVPKMYQREKL